MGSRSLCYQRSSPEHETIYTAAHYSAVDVEDRYPGRGSTVGVQSM